MSADQDESGKPPREEEAPPKEAASPGVRRDSDPPLRGSMADLEQELAQLLDDAPDEEDDDEEDDDAPLVPPVDADTFKKPDLEPFDSDSGEIGGSGYDSWGPKIDLSQEVPVEPPGLSADEMKAALAAPGTAKDTGVESTPESDSKPESDSTSAQEPSSAKEEAAADAAPREDSTRDSHPDNEDADDEDGEDEGEDEEPDSDVPDTRPSEADVVPTKRPAPPKATRPARARVTSSSPPEAKGPFTPLRAVLVVLGVLVFIWLIRGPSATPEPVPQKPTAQPSAETPEAELPPPTPEPLPAEMEASPEPQADEPGSDAAPSDSAAPPTGPDAALLAGDEPLPFDRVAVISALGPFAIEAGRCRRKTDPPGRVMVNLVIAPSGKITSIATGAKHSGTKTEECILEKLRRAKLEPHSGGDQTVALPVQLK